MKTVLRKRSRGIHLVTGSCLAGLVSTIAATALTFDAASRYEWDPILGFAIVALAVGILMTIMAKLERPRVPILMVPFGALAALASRAYSVASHPLQSYDCAVVTVSRGFPLYYSYGYNPTGVNCPTLLLPIVTRQMIAMPFWLDAIFYVGVGLAIIQLYRGSFQKPFKSPTTSLLRANKETHFRERSPGGSRFSPEIFLRERLGDQQAIFRPSFTKTT